MSERIDTDEIDDDCPSVEDLRVTARTMRYFVREFQEIEGGWPWWKRLTMDYPSREQYMMASIKMDSIADVLERKQAQTHKP